MWRMAMSPLQLARRHPVPNAFSGPDEHHGTRGQLLFAGAPADGDGDCREGGAQGAQRLQRGTVHLGCICSVPLSPVPYLTPFLEFALAVVGFIVSADRVLRARKPSRALFSGLPSGHHWPDIAIRETGKADSRQP